MKNVKVLMFHEEACRFESLVGGKGSSLALLSNHGSADVKFTVPAGFCLTVSAWNRQIAANEDIQNALKQVEKVAKGVVEGKMEESCERVSKLIASAPVDSMIQDCIREALQVFYSDNFPQNVPKLIF